MSPYIPILGVLFFSAALLGVMVLASLFVGPKRYNKSKYMPYECGIDPTPQHLEDGRFPVRYYLVAMTFIIFDIEVVFMYPWAVSFNHLGLFGLVTMLTFIALITVPYIYEWRRGALNWD